MKSAIEGLEPKLLWEHFYQISQIPRGSGNETAVGEYIISVAKRNDLVWKKDELGNIVVSQPASPGYENHVGVVIQGHTDMVCEKNNDTNHDFEKDAIKLVRDGEWLTADGTTLGADNGIGFCAALALMEDNSVVHPAMDYLFTVDEETGLTGANGLRSDFFEGRMLINLDSEEDGAFYMGCAGGQHTILRKSIEWENAPSNSKTVKITVAGLKGGHSGLNISDGLGNANKLLSRFLYELSQTVSYNLAAFNGGNKHNAIPREADALIVFAADQSAAVSALVSKFDADFKNELQFSDAGVSLNMEDTQDAVRVFTKAFGSTLIRLIYSMPHGVIEMSHAVEGLVETSTNMAIVETKGDAIEMLTSQRSSVASSIIDIADKVKSIGELAGFEVEQGGGYPAWEPNPDSKLLKKAIGVYKAKYNTDPEVKAIHAGLECGIIGEKYDGMDMLSFGPTIEGAHSPDERVRIADVSKMWDYLLTLLKEL